MVFLAGIFAYNLRFFSYFTEIRPVFYEIVFQQYIKVIFFVAAIFVIIFAIAGLYAIRNTRRVLDEMTSVFIASTAAFAVVIIIIFFQRELFSSRFIVLTGWVLAIAMVMFGRLLVRGIQRALLKKGIGLHNVIIIGSDNTAESIVKQMYKRPQMGYRIVERISNFDEDAQLKVNGKLKESAIDEIILADTSLPKEQILAIRDFCNDNHIIYKYVTDLFEIQPAHIEINTIADIPIIEVKRTKLDGWGKIAKRLFDTVFALIGMVVLSPLFLLVSVLIIIDSQGGVFAKLKRVGVKGNSFKLYKFRSMVRNAEHLKQDLVGMNERTDGPLFKIKNDPRITRIGRFLRKTSLDELPQLINVIRGEMSLVGPRPHEPEEVQRYNRWQKKLLAIKPGMTGLAQISGRSDLNFEDEAKLDIYYIENWSPKLDIQIFIKTPWVVITGKSAS